MLKKIAALPYVLCMCIICNAQLNINANIQEFTTDNGLPSNGIKGIQWDETTGFL